MDYKDLIASNLAACTGLDKAQVEGLIEIPPKLELGDFAFPCFVLAKTLHKAPPMIANELKDSPELVKGFDGAVTVDTAGPYINFRIDRGILAKSVISEITEAGDQYGNKNIGEGKNVIIEFSSPNIAKPFHVGHAFTTILGNSLANIYSRLGYNVIRFNHLGDYGTQFGKLITAYRLWGDEQAMQDNPIDELTRIYVKFHDECKVSPEREKELEDTARDNFRKLEEGEPEEVALWQRFRDLSLQVFEKTYERMGIKFDNYNGESFYSSRIPGVVKMLEDKGLLEESEGAKVVKLDEEGLPPCLVVKSDGTTIYASRDLAAVLYRHEEYNFYKNIYVVGLPQQLHFKQVFAVLKKAGYDFADDCVHVGFGLLKFKPKKDENGNEVVEAFSTRAGNIIKLDDFLDKTTEKTAEIIRKNSELRGGDMTDEQIAKVSEIVGLGAVSVQPLVYTLACTNGMVVNNMGERRTHVGRAAKALEDSFNIYTDETLEAEDHAFMLKLRDTTLAAIEEARFSQIVGVLEQSHGAKITGRVQDVIELTGKAFRTAENKFHALTSKDEMVFAHGAVK